MLDLGALNGGVILRAEVDFARVDRFLDLGSSYYRAFTFMVDERQVRLTCGGWRSAPGSPSIGFGVSDEEQAREVIDEIGYEISNRSKVKALQDLAEVVAQTQEEIPVRVSLERTSYSTKLHAEPTPRPQVVVEATERRIYIDKAGGHPSMVRAFDIETKHHFTMRASDDVAKLAASMLYRDVDAQILLRMRADTFLPVGGELLGLAPVSNEPLTFEALKTWWTGRYAGRA